MAISSKSLLFTFDEKDVLHGGSNFLAGKQTLLFVTSLSINKVTRHGGHSRQGGQDGHFQQCEHVDSMGMMNMKKDFGYLWMLVDTSE